MILINCNDNEPKYKARDGRSVQIVEKEEMKDRMHGNEPIINNFVMFVLL